MHPEEEDPSRTLEFGHTHPRAARSLPKPLALMALGLAMATPWDDHWRVHEALHVALISGGWGSGWLAWSLYRLATPDRPTLVLSPEGLHHRLAIDRLIPWSEVRGVRKQDVVVEAGLNIWGTHPGATAVTISAAFHDRLMKGRQLKQYLFGTGHFGAKGDVVDLYVFPKQAFVPNDELLAAVEARWRAYGGPGMSSRRGEPPPAGAAAMMEAAEAARGRVTTPLFTPLTLVGTIVAGALVVALATGILGLW